ncbi:MAG: isoleucine--tRNA ligase [Bacteroides sp.]|nr:MAG: isoleucine--tRNA ligase [Bacteroides sp.]
MKNKNIYREYTHLDIISNEQYVLKLWNKKSVFDISLISKSNNNIFSFYEGPPSINGKPGIHHVLSRTYKDIFCRYKTMKGYKVYRKAGWDAHGLPVELSVEKELKITKFDIPNKISIKKYCNECRKMVQKNIKHWNVLTKKMGYWIDINNGYNTFHNSYIESVWNIIKKLFNKKLIYKGYKIQPYSPAAGTGLSSHELNQLGSYKEITDTSIVVKFNVMYNRKYHTIFNSQYDIIYILVWTTTPWTLPANSALAINKSIIYVKIKQYDFIIKKYVYYIISKNMVYDFFDKNSCSIESEFYGQYLIGLKYCQIMPYISNNYLNNNAFFITHGNFVNNNSGTGIVHIASMFGIDDFTLSMQKDIPIIGLKQKNSIFLKPIVDLQGRFINEISDFAGKYVRPEYDSNQKSPSTCDLIIKKLEINNQIFKKFEYKHLYPHCWRTDKPVLYYPMESWFIRTTSIKKDILKYSQLINWIPKQIGKKRFYDWLNNIVDWNFSRSRFWGTPLPIWQSKNNKYIVCIGSLKELKNEIINAIQSSILNEKELKDNIEYINNMESNNFDLHRPYIDKIILVRNNVKLYRESDVIDVWFDSGCMPYAQYNYPFNNKEIFKQNFPADFISEGIDQTRGWFFTLHIISVMINKSIAFRNVIPHGLILDANGNKMSKKYGNTIDPLYIINKYGADILRWYLISNGNSSDNIKFDIKELENIKNRFFGTLHNVYKFFSIYANIDNFQYTEDEINFNDRPEIDQWIITRLNYLIKEINECMDLYECNKAVDFINYFVIDLLSNWYIRICRKRFWKSEYSKDKISAYQTLYKCIYNIAIIIAPIAPFYGEILYQDITKNIKKNNISSVHLNNFVSFNTENINKELDYKMQYAKNISSIVLSLRKKAKINVRIPLNSINIFLENPLDKYHINSIKNIILSETNIKNIEYSKKNNILKKIVKPNYKILGPVFGSKTKIIANKIELFNDDDINKLETNKFINIDIEGNNYKILNTYVKFIYDNKSNWKINYDNKFAISLDINLNINLKNEGLLRELISKIQIMRKKYNFNIVDKINICIGNNVFFYNIINENYQYFCNELLCNSVSHTNEIDINFEEIIVNNKNLLLKLDKCHIDK